MLLIPSIHGNVLGLTDVDPLFDLSITFDVLKIRSLEHDDPQLNLKEIIDEGSDPDFYFVLYVNDERFSSDKIRITSINFLFII